MAKSRWLIDVDTGCDDAIALLLALRAPSIDVIGVTVVNGNVPIHLGLGNTCRVLDLAEAPATVAVARGAPRPLVEPLQDAIYVHGDDGLGGYPLPVSNRRVDPRPAAWYLVQTLLAEPEPVTVVALAPLTNLALALRLEPSIVQHIARLVIMGGSADGSGNHSAAGEFNIAIDPEAAAIVFGCGAPITMVGLDPCRLAAVPVDRAAAWRVDPNPRIQFLGGIVDYLGRQLSRDAVAIFDAVAVAVALDPTIAVSRRLPVAIELAPGHHRGAVLVDRRACHRHDANWPLVDVVFEVDRDVFTRRLLEGIM